MIDRFLNWLLLKLLPHFDIVKEVDGQTVLYLRRFYLKDDRRSSGGDGGGIFIHYIVRSDDDPDPHDHPWEFKSFVFGEYEDEQWIWDDWHGRVFQGYQKVRWQLVRRAATHIHRLILKKPVWSLVVTGPKIRDWNFVTPTRPVHWRTYLKLDENDTNHA